VRTGEPKRTSLIFILLIAAMVMMLVVPAFADGGDDIEIENTLTGGDVSTSSETIIDGNNSYAAAQSLGDVDINDCLASTQWGIPVLFAKQKVQENPWCQSIYLDAIGAYDAAAKVRCTTDTLKTIYADPAECEKAVMFHVKPPPKPKTTDRDDEDYKALRADLETFKTEIAQAKEDTRKARVEAKRATTVAQEAYRPQIVQTPFLTDEKRAKLQAILDER